MALTGKKLRQDARLDLKEDGPGRLSSRQQEIDDALDALEGKPDPKHRASTARPMPRKR